MTKFDITNVDSCMIKSISIFRLLLLCFSVLMVISSAAQSVSQRLTKAYALFEGDEQLRHATSSLYVVDARTGAVVFSRNAGTGLAPASTQKIITSVTALELLGKEYRYQTGFGFVEKNNAKHIYIKAGGDPSLGSPRWPQTRTEFLLEKLSGLYGKTGFSFSDSIWIDRQGWESQPVPDGWIWQDIANYYGAGAQAWNWRENQFDLLLKSGKGIGSPVEIMGTDPSLPGYEIQSELLAAQKGTGDNAYIYFTPAGGKAVVRGTIPVEENRFMISGAMPDPGLVFGWQLLASPGFGKGKDPAVWAGPARLQTGQVPVILFNYVSPALDSLIYWFNKKSINLYGEALLKTMAFEKSGLGSTDSGVALVRKFWSSRGLDEEELNISDGSGLSPLNRVTTHAQVEILKYARSRDWFPVFLRSLPEYNGMTMKSGTISGVKGFCGYHRAKDGREYIFSFLVNNYSGRTAGVVTKMYKVLDELKQ